MKELTIVEKAKRYESALERCRKLYNEAKANEYTSDIEDYETIFPELKESEDERIRGAIIDHLKDNNLTEWAAWLEKQGEYANFHNKIQVGDKVTRNRDGVLVNLSQLKRVAKPSEKQGEQKPDDKVEPKFHEGDWVVISTSDGEKVVQIDSIEYFKSGEPKYITSEGRWFGNGTKARLWTIQDARDGDILVCPKYAGDIIPNIFIFKNIEIKDNDVFCYCSFLKTFMTGGYVANADPINNDFYPATKEQCDILRKAMADAGYTFDFNKKKLKILKY